MVAAKRLDRAATAREARAALDAVTDQGGHLTAQQAQAIRAWAWDLAGAKHQADQVAASCARDAAQSKAQLEQETAKLVSEERHRLVAQMAADHWRKASKGLARRLRQLRARKATVDRFPVRGGK